MKILFILLFLTLFLVQCKNDEGVAGKKVVLEGLLTISDHCLIPEGCGPTYKLWDNQVEKFVPLLGSQLNDKNELIVKVIGYEIPLPEEEYHDMNYGGPYRALEVNTLEALSSIPYHDFLIHEAESYSQSKYGCILAWDKSFSWDIISGKTVLKVKMSSDYFIEAWFDGNNGELIFESNNINGINPCN